MQQGILLGQRLQFQLEAPGPLLAHQEFLEQKGVVGDGFGFLAESQGKELVTQREQARGFEADDRHAPGHERHECGDHPHRLALGALDLARREIGTAAAQRRRAERRPGDGDTMARRRQHAPRGMQDPGLEIVGEGIRENHDRGVGIVDIGGGEKGIAPPLRQPALLGEAEIALHEPAEIEQPRQAPRPRRDFRQAADHPVAQAKALGHASRRLHLDLHARHVDTGRTVALAALAADAEIHRGRHGIGGERCRTELA